MAMWFYGRGYDIDRRCLSLTGPEREVDGTKEPSRVVWEVAGVPTELIAAMSRRSQDIQKLSEQFQREFGAAKGGRWDAFKASQRNAKVQLDAVALRAWYAEIGKAHGFSPKECAALAVLASKRVARSLPEAHGREADLFRSGLLKSVTADRAWMSPRQLSIMAEQRARGLMPWEEARKVAARMVERGDLVLLPGGRITTPAIVQLEKETTEAGRKLSAGRREAISDAWLDAAFKAREKVGHPLDQGQRDAIQAALSGRRLTVVVGIPGSGKGTASRIMVDGFHEQERTVIAVAVAGATAQRAKEDSGADRGLPVAGLLKEIEVGKTRLGREDVVLVDEAGMLAHQEAHDLVRVVEQAGASLVLIGDHRQAQPIGPGGMFERMSGIAAQDGGLVELRVNHRAHSAAEAAAWLDLREGRYLEAARHWQADGRFILHDSKPEMFEAMAARWFEEGQRGSMLVSSSNADRDALNQLAQGLRLQAGELGTDLARVATGHEVRGGDRVMFSQQIKATDLPQVPGVLPERTVRMRNGEVRTFPERETMVRQPRIENGTKATVEEVDGKNVSLKLHEPGVEEGKERVVTLPANKAPVELGYASHVVKGQGITVEDHGQAVVDPRMSLEDLGVAISRGREGAVLNAVRPPTSERGVVDFARETGAVDAERGSSPAQDKELAQIAEVVKRVQEETQARRDLVGVRSEVKTTALGAEPGPADLS
ncbi:MAG TPA: AAA family ATPase, partial [Actinomycetota bacterium]